MFKKVQTKLTLLLVILAIAFAAVFLFLRYTDEKREDALFREREKEQQVLFDKIAALKGKSLEMIVNSEYSLWNEMVDFIKGAPAIDKEWVEENIGWLFKNYGFAAAWVYDPQFSHVYSDNRFNDKKLAEIPVPKEVLESLFAKSSFIHFFIDTPHGLMEIRGASVHASVDTQRRNPPSGYLVVGNLWGDEYVGELANLTGCTLDARLLGDGDTAKDIPQSLGVITFSRFLPGWDGNPIAVIDVRRESTVMKEMKQSSGKQFLFIAAFLAVSLLVLTVTLVYLVNVPLRTISSSLKKEKPDILEGLMHSKSEFGDLAKLIVNFFDQRGALINEVAERRRAEEELGRAKHDLEEWSKKLEAKVRERTEELKQSQDKLMRSEKLALMGQLASSVSHELRTPLTAIKNSVYLIKLLKADEENPKIAAHVAMIEKEVDACTQVISNMLGFARPKGPTLKETDFEEVVKESLSLSVIPTNISVSANYNDAMPPLMVDPMQLRQVCDNMIKNAVEAMASGGTLTITTWGDGKWAIVEFKDTGIGIPSRDIQKIFDPLYSTFPKGTGLGLSVCQQIVEAHGGAIEVESEEGKGTTFRVKLPI